MGSVLVADDDPALRDLWSHALAAGGFEVVTAGSGSDALVLLENATFAVVVLDNRMPGCSGLEVLERLRASPETATLPVIMVTAHADVGDRVRALEAGATDYLVKPVSLDELVARVRAQVRLQSVWRHVVERRLGERARVLTALSRLRPGPTPEDTAAAAALAIAGMGGVVGVAILSFLHETGVVPLAVHVAERGLVPDPRPLRPDEAARVLAGTARGPWIDEAGRSPWAGATLWEALDHLVTVHAPFAPAGSTGRPLGALAITVHPGRQHDVSESLSAVLDFAAITGVLLGPALEQWTEQAATAARVAQLLDQRAFFPVFQPVFDLARSVTVGYEALTRFEDGTPPDVQLSEARRAGLHLDLEEAMMAAALERAGDLPDSTLVFVNASPALIMERGAALQQFEAPAGRLVFEVTEHERVDDYRELPAALDALRPDLKVCVDDCGAGYASLRHVLALEPDFVKLDAEWVRGLELDFARQALVSGLAAFAETTQVELIAEGIETDVELDVLRRLGIRLGQGYLLGRPARQHHE